MKARKVLTAVLAALMVISMLAGCGGGSGSNAKVELNEDVLKLEGLLASAEPLDLTLHLHYGGKPHWQTDGRLAKKAFEYTNINLKNTASAAQADSSQAFTTMMLSDVLPDVIHGDTKKLNEAGLAGALIPIEDYIKDYAPNMYKYFQEYPENFDALKAPDGHVYFIPRFYEESPAQGWIIRKDWLDKVGMEPPTNVDEYYQMLKAFREKDPNGNGVKDEIPYYDSGNTLQKLFGLWGVPAEWYWYTDDGKIYAKFMTDEYKYALKEVARWYAEGLIDPEIFTRRGAREQLWAENNGGACINWFSSTLKFNETVTNPPDFELLVIDPPMDINGNVISWNPRQIVTTQGWGISKDNKYVAETMKYLDFWFSEEGKNLMFYGIEGEEYTVQPDGSFKFTEKVTSYATGVPTYLQDNGFSLNIGVPAPLAAEVAGMTGYGKAAFEDYKAKDFNVKPFPPLTYTAEENRVMTTTYTDVFTCFDEFYQGAILGNIDVDAAWDSYIEQLKDYGVEKVLAAMQAAYDRMYK